MHFATFTFFVLLSVGLVAALSPLEPLLVIDCDGTINLMPNTNVPRVFLKGNILKVAADTFHTVLKTRIKDECPALTDQEFEWAFSFNPAFWLNLITEGRTTALTQCNSSAFLPIPWLSLQQFPFDGVDIVVKWTNPAATCSRDGYLLGNPCALKLPLDDWDASFIVNVQRCTASLFPKISLFCSGSSCPHLLKPCADGGTDCPLPLECTNLGVPTLGELWNLSTGIGVYNSTTDVSPGCFPVDAMFSKIKTFVRDEAFGTAAALPVAPNVSLCTPHINNVSNLGPESFFDIIVDLNFSMPNISETFFDCTDMCTGSTPSATYPPADFPPSSSFPPPMSFDDTCSWSRFHYYCDEIDPVYGFDFCANQRKKLRCAELIGCYWDSFPWVDIQNSCWMSSCSDCYPNYTWDFAGFPPPISGGCGTPDLCSRYGSKWQMMHSDMRDIVDLTSCWGNRLELDCMLANGCTTSDTAFIDAMSRCNNESCYNNCPHKRITISTDLPIEAPEPVPAFSKPSPPSLTAITIGGIPLLNHSCNGWLQLFPQSTFALGLSASHQTILNFLYGLLNFTANCRAAAASGSLNWWQFESRFAWIPLMPLWDLTTPRPTESELGPDISDFRKWMDWLNGTLVQMPDTCTHSKWVTDGTCAFSYVGLNRFFKADVNFVLSATRCPSVNAFPSVQIECFGSGCMLFKVPVPCLTPGSSVGCPAGTMCYDIDAELAYQGFPADPLAEILYRNPAAHVSDSLHEFVKAVLALLGSPNPADNNICWFAPIPGQHLGDEFFGNNTYASDWADGQSIATGNEITLPDLKPWPLPPPSSLPPSSQSVSEGPFEPSEAPPTLTVSLVALVLSAIAWAF